MKQLFKSTPKDFIANLPRYTFKGKIVVINNNRDATKAIRALKTYSVLGIDTETRPAFRKGVVHKVALLQICTEDVCFLFRLNRLGLTDEIVSLLTDANILKIGLSLNDDFLALKKRRTFSPAAFIDLQHTAKNLGLEDMSLQKLVGNMFHKRMSKSARLSNWEIAELSDSQKIYAATDAFACLDLYKEMKRLAETGDFDIVETVA